MQRPIFHEPWWLDAVAPDAWEELSVVRDGHVRAVLPYARRRIRPNVVILGAPPLTPYLGPLVDPGDGKQATQLGRDRELQGELLDALPAHDVYKTTLPLDHRNWPVLAERSMVGTPRITYVIDDIADTERVWAEFGESTRRAVRKAEKRLAVRTDLDPGPLVRMAAATFARQGRDLPYEPAVLRRAATAAVARDRGRILTAVDTEGIVHASLLVVWDDRSAYYLAGGADPDRRESAALSLLLWEAIKVSAAHADRFDFEGSMVPGVERFFRGFGGRQHTYLGVLHLSRRARVAWAARDAWLAVRGR